MATLPADTASSPDSPSQNQNPMPIPATIVPGKPKKSYLDGLVDPEPEEGPELVPDDNDEDYQKYLAKIRTQVESIFSDERLVKDRFLRKEMKGEMNKPVPVKLIASFRNMRKYLFVDIVKAMKTSQTVRLLSTNEHLKRVIPLTTEQMTEAKKIDKVRRKEYFATLSGSSHSRVTGFEPWYCDSPVHPLEYEKERKTYDPANRISLRLTGAVHKFFQARTLHNLEMSIFTSWLRYGGWEMGPRQFTGKDVSELADRDQLDQAVLLSTIKIDADMDDPTEWVVDFEKVTKGYLSSYFEEAVRQTPDSVDMAVNVLTNFFNYLLHHDVCLEYNKHIIATQELLKTAKKELPNLIFLRSRMPDNFSISMSVLSGGMYASIFGHDLPFLSYSEFEQGEDWGQDSRMNMTEARNIARLGLDTCAPDLVPAARPALPAIEEILDEDEGGVTAWDGTNEQDWFSVFQERATIRTCHKMGLEVISIEKPSEAAIGRYHEVAENPPLIDGKTPAIEPSPIGLLRCRQWSPPSFERYDLPPDVILTVKGNDTQEYLLPIESTRLHLVFPGMKIYGSICIITPKPEFQTDSSSSTTSPPPRLVFIDQTDNLYPTFYTILLNDLEIQNLSQAPSSRLRQSKEVIWHDSLQAQQWEKSEHKATAMAGLNEGNEEEDDENENESEKKDGKGVTTGSSVGGGTDGPKKKKKKKSKAKKGVQIQEPGAEGVKEREKEGEAEEVGNEGEDGTTTTNKDGTITRNSGDIVVVLGLAPSVEAATTATSQLDEEFNDF